ncbi:hypothetical protein K435DRAFT_811393 [Dendrothele bispora CBS 962.96]|uniref:Uncharacterized protein n=1 Tax=Dendrothele bispora (strain CBS 962.96) TaxID=1314807 RepID=A0A4S8KSK6_DENBC|nr:hypothetical protein K435DRAFT_811393 [Dendrothele bispora CBS 962.96]
MTTSGRLCFGYHFHILGLNEELGQVGVDLSVDLLYLILNLVSGKYLIDHPLIFTWCSVKSNATFNDTIINGLVLCEFGQCNSVYEDFPQGKGSNDSSSEPRSILTELSSVHAHLTLLLLFSSPSLGFLALASVKSGTFPYPNIDFLTNEWDLVATLRALQDTDIFLNAVTLTLSPDVIENFW